MSEVLNCKLMSKKNDEMFVGFVGILYFCSRNHSKQGNEVYEHPT